jgi:hypothetical protein
VGNVGLKTNASGFYWVELLPGEYNILALKEGYVPDMKFVVVSENVNKNIFLTPMRPVIKSETRPVEKTNTIDIWIIIVIIIVIVFISLLMNEYLRKKKLRKKQKTN